MHFLSGKISDRIRSGELPKDVQINPSRQQPEPKAESVRHGQGQGLGEGATRARSGE